MGFEDREYFREDSHGPRWGHETPTVRNLLIITIVVFLFQSILTREGGMDGIAKFGAKRISLIDEWFMLDSPKVLGGQVWRALTYAFCHDRLNPFGLVFNMLGLWFLGTRLERMYGSRELLWFYLTAAITGGVLFTAFGISSPIEVPLSGSAPAVLALFTLYACHFPREQILFFWCIPVQIRVLLAIYTALDIYSILMVSQGEFSMMAGAFAASHLGGIAFGFCYHQFSWHVSGLAEWFSPNRLRRAVRRRSTQQQLRVFAPDNDASDKLDSAVDAILAKIHELGSDSLTEAERMILTKASERAKNRQRF